MDTRRRKLRNSHLRRATVDLLGKGSVTIGDDCARDRLEKDTVFGRYLFRVPNEYSTGSIDDVSFDARGD